MERQINLYAFKKYKAVFYGILIGFLVSLFVRGCQSSEPQLATVKIKEIVKTLPADTIVKHENIVVKDRSNEKKLSKDILEMYQRIENYQEEIDYLHDAYKNSDSIQKDSIFKLLSEIKNFESNFEDENIKLKINGIVAKNEVKEVTPTYTIKERKIEVPIKTTKFRILTGFGVANTIQVDKAIFNANIGFQNAKGNVLGFGYDSEKRFMINYSFSLIKF